MAHPRALIRTHVVTLMTNLPAVQDRVYASRVYPMQQRNLPGICVFSLTETSELANEDRDLERRLDLAVDIYAARADGAPDDALDDLAATVEDLMEMDPTFGRLALTSWLAETTIGFDGEGDQANGLARLRYTVLYRTVPTP